MVTLHPFYLMMMALVAKPMFVINLTYYEEVRQRQTSESGWAFKAIYGNLRCKDTKVYIRTYRDIGGTSIIQGNLTLAEYASKLNNTVVYPLLGGEGWACALLKEELCNGVSKNVKDECGCGVDTLLCKDGSGCVVNSQVCDGVVDCMDASDECPCLSYLTCQQDIIKNFSSQLGEVCNHWKDTACTSFSSSRGNMDEYSRNFNCSKTYRHHCDRFTIISKPYPKFVYHCNDQSTFVRVRYADFCDGLQNCPDNTDELDCPNFFYCKSDNSSILKTKVCDGRFDCTDMSDECQSCIKSHVSTDGFIIGNDFLKIYVILEVIIIVILNITALNNHCKLSDSHSRSKHVDRILCICLAFYDLGISVYLIIICVMSYRSGGVYCKLDVEWRASTLCNLSGFIFQLVSFGSLQIAVVMSVTRCRVINSSLGSHINFKAIYVILVFVNFINLILAFLPVLPVFCFQSQMYFDRFIYRYIFEDNPIVGLASKQQLVSVLAAYNNISSKTEVIDLRKQSSLEILSQLENITSKGELFHHDKVRYHGYYGASPLCLPAMYSSSSNPLIYRTLFIAIITTEFVTIAASYIMIFLAFKRTQAKVGGMQHTEKKKATDKEFRLSMKIFCLILLHVLCWLPILIQMLLSLFDMSLPLTFQEFIAIFFSPLVAIFNPILHCDYLSHGFGKMLSAVFTAARACFHRAMAKGPME